LLEYRIKFSCWNSFGDKWQFEERLLFVLNGIKKKLERLV